MKLLKNLSFSNSLKALYYYFSSLICLFLYILWRLKFVLFGEGRFRNLCDEDDYDEAPAVVRGLRACQ